MPRAAQGAAFAVAVLAVGGLAWWLLGSDGPAAVPGDRASSARPSRSDGAGARPGEPAPPPPEAPAETAVPEPPAGIALRGRVTDRAGNPVAGAVVEARPPVDPGLLDLRILGDALFEETPPRARATTGPDGAFVLRGLPAGTWTVGAKAAGHGPAREEGVVLHPSAEAPPVLLVLGPGHGLLVRVLDADGAALPGAEVVATRMGGVAWIPAGEALARASTDSAGLARLEGLGEGRLFLVVRAGQGRVAGRGVQVPEEREVEIRLGGSAALVVRVSLEGGGPVEGAAVAAVLVIPEGAAAVLLRGLTGPEGIARFEGLAPGTVSLLSAEKAGLAPAVLGGPQGRRPLHDEFSTLRENGTLELEIHLRPGAVLAGTVLLQPSGSPVARARVTLYLPDLLAFGMRRTAVSDEAGAYRLEGLPGGKAVVFAHAEGAATAGAVPGGFPVDLLFGRGGPSPLAVEILDGPAETRHDLLVEATGSVAGRVLGPDGAPAAGARVSVRKREGAGSGPFEPGEETPPAPVLSAADGTFRVEGVPTAKNLVAVAALAGRVPGVSDAFSADAGAAVEGLTIRLSAGGVVAGRVTGPDGAPVAGAAVRVASRVDRWRAGEGVRLAGEGARDAETDADGGFRVEAFPAGSISVTFTAEGFVRRTVGDLQARDGEETRADAALEAGREIRGRVLDAAGVAVAGARVAARNNERQPPSGVRTANTTTGADGTFRIPGLPAGTFTLNVSSPVHPGATLPSVDSGGGPVEVRLPPAVRISGRVTDLSGNPLAGVRVDATPAAEGRVAGGAVSGADGAFEIRNLVAGAYRLDARPRRGWAERRVDGVEGGSTGIEIRLEKALSISGRVVGLDGNPASGRGRILVLDATGNQVASTRWDGRGEFQAGGMREGTYSLHARVDGPPALVGTATAVAGAEGVVLRVLPE